MPGCGGYEKLIDPDCRDTGSVGSDPVYCRGRQSRKDSENQKILKVPIVRNGKQAAIGCEPDIWKEWK